MGHGIQCTVYNTPYCPTYNVNSVFVYSTLYRPTYNVHTAIVYSTLYGPTHNVHTAIVYSTPIWTNIQCTYGDRAHYPIWINIQCTYSDRVHCPIFSNAQHAVSAFHCKYRPSLTTPPETFVFRVQRTGSYRDCNCYMSPCCELTPRLSKTGIKVPSR